jgi:hypothetical protein
MRETLRKVTIGLPEGLWKRARHFAVDQDLDLQDVLAAALIAYLAKHEKGGSK